jgi:hypothetical protein
MTVQSNTIGQSQAGDEGADVEPSPGLWKQEIILEDNCLLGCWAM